MQSLNNNFNLHRLERYLTLSWQSGAIPVIILTKRDLVEDYESYVREVESIAIGVEIMKTSEIREEDSRGRHTTTSRNLIMLPNGAMVIDTPGMRELGMWEVSVGLDKTFQDVEQYLGKCKFSDCSHTSEPGCKILEAIENGELSQDRFNSYIKL